MVIDLCFTYDLPMFYLWFTYVLPMNYLCFTYNFQKGVIDTPRFLPISGLHAIPPHWRRAGAPSRRPHCRHGGDGRASWEKWDEGINGLV